MAILIQPDYTCTVVHPANGHSFTLQEMQSFVGGDIELVPLPKAVPMMINVMHPDSRHERMTIPWGCEMYINEEGKLHPQFTFNTIATKIAYLAQGIFPQDTIVGNALICTPVEAGEEEEETPYDDRTVDHSIDIERYR